MGVRNLRAICPNCGGKIHTQPKGLGHFTWANSWLLVQTGKECQHCGVELSGKVAAGNKAILAEDADKTWREREIGTTPRDEPEYPFDAEALFEIFADVLRANKHIWSVGRLTKITPDPSRLRVTFTSPMRQWEASAEPSGEKHSRLVLKSRRQPGVFADWGEQKRVEKKLLQAVGSAAHGRP